MNSRVVAIALIPSTYGLIGWFVAFTLFEYRHIPWFETTTELYLAFLLQAGFFLISIIVHFNIAHFIFRQRVTFGGSITSLISGIHCMHLAGFLGICLYVWDFSRGFGGIGGFFETFLFEAFRIRQYAEQQSSAGVQLSYFGWVAIVLSPIAFRCSKIGMAFWLIVIGFIQYAANFLFIDRTRPIWILLMLVMVVGWAYRDRLSLKVLMKNALLIPLVGIGMFGLIGFFVGKVNSDEGLWLATVESAYYYITSGFAYLNFIISYENVVEISFVRTLAPLVNFFAVLGLAEPAPSTILPFYDIPTSTNVGTSLEPFFRDGGYGYLLFGCLAGSFVLDSISLLCLRAKTMFSIHFWACAVFVSATSFFVQKLGNLSVWIFLFCACVSMFAASIRTRSRSVILLAR